jgi:septation ring formation regulator EzrA
MLKLSSFLFAIALLATGCSSMYYAGMETVGVHKRDIMVDRVEDVQESQEEAQKEFKSALEHFGTLVTIKDTDLKKAYEEFNDEYEDAKDAADEVSSNIKKLEDVSMALFEEWEDEIVQYSNIKLQEQSKEKLRATRKKYDKMMNSMRKSEQSMQPILATFHDNVLILKHSLNAQAIGALKGEFDSLKNNIDTLIEQMNKSIEESGKFIKEMK